MSLSVNPTTGLLDAFGGTSLPLTQPPVGDYTVLESDIVVLISGNTTVTIPTAVGRPGKFYHLKKVDSGTTTTVAASSGQTLDGYPSVKVIQQYINLMIVSDGANWLIL